MTTPMPRYYLGLGSNQGDRRAFLESALERIREFAVPRRISSLSETAALLPARAPRDWNRPYLNLAVEIDSDLSPTALLEGMKSIERDFGRSSGERWAPRTIDIDLLVAEGHRITTETLTLPHPGIHEREFVLGPLAEIAPELLVDGTPARLRAKAHPRHQPKLMGILNLTPDSFSDGGRHRAPEALARVLEDWDRIGIAAIDLGAESTRPGSEAVDAEEEWRRLRGPLDFARAYYGNRRLKPKISVDTRNAATAARALAGGADWINDVSGLSDPGMPAVLRASECVYVLTDSLSIPPSLERVLDEDADPVAQILSRTAKKLALLESAGIDRSRIVIDPGIGFGKTPIQSLEILRRIPEFDSLALPVLVGHSRKGFIGDWSGALPAERDLETLGISIALAERGVDYLRVHDPVLHHRALLAHRHVRRSR